MPKRQTIKFRRWVRNPKIARATNMKTGEVYDFYNLQIISPRTGRVMNIKPKIKRK